jgi:ectoine hydroxylase-related dioxygenase (phytanoyl-CoA dioxygenase family)
MATLATHISKQGTPAVATAKADYAAHGYAVLRDFFPRNLLDDYSTYLRQALREKVWPLFRSLGVDPDAADLADRVARRIADAIDPVMRQTLLGHFPLEVRMSDRIHAIASHLGRSELLHRLLGSDSLCMHLPPMSRFVPPYYHPAAVPPHQDASYNAHLSQFVTVWTPLVPIDEQCGGLVLFEGEQPAVQPARQAANGWLNAVQVDALNPIGLVGLDVGDVVILSPTVVHASAPNTSARTRLSMDLRVFSAATPSGKHHINLTTLETMLPS